MDSGKRLSASAWCWLCSVLILLAAPALAQEPSLTVALSPKPIGLSQQTLFQIRVEVAAMRLLRVQPSFDLSGLQVAAGPFQEQSMQFVNGSISNTTTLKWRLRPTAIGQARIDNIRVEVGNDVLTTDGLTVEVQEESVPEAEAPVPRADPLEDFFRRGGDPFRRRAAAKPELHLRVETNPGDPFVGEPVHYTLYLFTRNDVTAVNAEELPDFEGFWKEEPSSDSDPRNAQTVTIDGRKWLRVALLERVLYPLRPGELTIEPATMAFAVDADSSGFFRDRRSVQRTSPPATLTVRPLPQGGSGASTPVGRLALTASLEPSTLEVGQAARLEVVARSSGNLRRLPDPKIVVPAGVEIYPPQGDIERTFTASGVEFARRWSWVIVPREAGSFALPPLEVSFFDLQSETFQTATAATGSLTAVPPTMRAASPTFGSDRSLHPLRTAPVAALEARSTTPWSNWMLMIGFAAAVALGVNDLRRDRGSAGGTLTGDGAGSRRDLLAAIEDITADDPRRTAVAIEAVVRDYLVARWGVDPATSPGGWVQRLADTDMPEGVQTRLTSLAHDLHYLRYAPQLSQTVVLAHDLRDAALEWARRLPRR